MPDSPSSSLLAELMDLLDRIRERIEMFVAVLDAEETAVRGLSFEGLSQINMSKHTLLEEIRLLEERRATVIAQIADAWAVPSSELGLTALVQRVGQGDAARLRQLQRRLSEVAKAARDRNRSLAVLVSRSLEFFRESLGIVRLSSKEIFLYSSSGSWQPPAVETGLIERRE